MCPDLIDNKYAEHIILDTLGTCRLAILDQYGQCQLYGQWFYEDGMCYSNTSYKEVRYTTRQKYSGSYYYNQSYARGFEQKKEADEKAALASYLDEIGGFGTADDLWEEDYIESKSVNQVAFLSKQPSRACTSCPDYRFCVGSGLWGCKTEEEANEYIEKEYVIVSTNLEIAKVADGTGIVGANAN